MKMVTLQSSVHFLELAQGIYDKLTLGAKNRLFIKCLCANDELLQVI
jgi:hypothetical protein